MKKTQDEFVFSKENLEQAKIILSKYPSDRRFSAIMPLLTLAQKQNGGYLTTQIIDYLSVYLKVSTMALYEVANFYSMYNLNPVGEYLIQVCDSVVCMVKGSQEIYDLCKKLTKTEGFDVSVDNLFSVKKVECLGACVNAPAIKVNDIFIENVNNDKLTQLVDNLKNKKILNGSSVVQKTLLLEDNK